MKIVTLYGTQENVLRRQSALGGDTDEWSATINLLRLREKKTSNIKGFSYELPITL